ncbi:MAG: FtsX-like permease family protein [Pseudomonadota bacterium]
MLFRYMLKELRNSPRFALLFILNMSLGLLGFISLDAIKHSFDTQLQASAKTLLGADLSMSARRPLTELEKNTALKSLAPKTRSQNLTNIFTMAAVGNFSSLVEVRAIEPDYPFYGNIILENAGVHRNELKIHSFPVIWIAPELALKLNVKIGSMIRIAKQEFKIVDIIKEDISSSFNTGMAPRIYMSQQWLNTSGLMQKGNTARHRVIYKIPENVSIFEQLAALQASIPEPSIRIESYQESGQDDGRMLGYLSDYLGLVALVSFSLAGIGAAYLYRDYFQQRSSSIAVVISLGLTHQRALLLYLGQVCFLGALSALFSALLALALIPLLLEVMREFSPIAFTAHLPLKTVGLAVLLGGVGSILICLPILNRLRFLKPSLLFHEQNLNNQFLKDKSWIAYVPVLTAFYALAVWQANSFKVGSLFFIVAMTVLIIFGLIGWVFLQGVKNFRRSRILSLRLGSVFLRAHPMSTISAFVAIGLGSTLIHLIPQIQGSLLSELANPAGQKLPSFFLFDVQEDQLLELNKLLQTIDINPQAISPMIMARITQVNGAAFTRDTENDGATREQQREKDFRNRGVNLSYRDTLALGESISKGNFFSGNYAGQGVGEVSLEKRYAERLDLEIGDQLTFDIQGLEIDAKITSLRQVKWNTFEPNFFILLQPGLIDDAPKTYLMNIPHLPLERKVETQREIIKNFPNTSVIDVTTLVARITIVIQQMSLILNIMAYLTIVTGLLVIYSIAQHQALARRWDHNLLKILGAQFPTLLRASLIEFASIAGLASILGAVIGLFSSFIIAKVIFQGVWYPQFQIVILISVGLVAVCVMTSLIATTRILKSKPKLDV